MLNYITNLKRNGIEFVSKDVGPLDFPPDILDGFLTCLGFDATIKTFYITNTRITTGQYHQLLQNLDDQLVCENYNIELKCQAVGKPQPIIDWYVNGSKHNCHAALNSCIENRLIIPTAKLASSGVYKCQAANILGEGKKYKLNLKLNHCSPTCTKMFLCIATC